MKKSRVLSLLALLFAVFLAFSLKGFSEELKWQTVEQTGKKDVSQILSNLPEWDGVYIVTRSGYIEVNEKNSYTQYQYVPSLFRNYKGSYALDPGKEIVIPVEDFIGILVKGEDFLEKVRLYLTEKESMCWFSKNCSRFRLFVDLDAPFSLSNMRRKTISPGIYLFSPEDPAKFFGTVEDKKYVAIPGRGYIFVFGLQKGSSFGELK